MVAGAAAFGAITSNLQPVMDKETFTQVSGHQIQKRETNETASDDPDNVTTIVTLAKQKAKRRKEALKELNNGQTPIQIWVKDVASISFFTNVGGLTMGSLVSKWCYTIMREPISDPLRMSQINVEGYQMSKCAKCTLSF